MLVEKGYFLLNLCRMASLWHQDKYLVNPSTNKYETIEDLVQDIYIMLANMRYILEIKYIFQSES